MIALASAAIMQSFTFYVPGAEPELSAKVLVDVVSGKITTGGTASFGILSLVISDGFGGSFPFHRLSLWC